MGQAQVTDFAYWKADFTLEQKVELTTERGIIKYLSSRVSLRFVFDYQKQSVLELSRHQYFAEGSNFTRGFIVGIVA